MTKCRVDKCNNEVTRYPKAGLCDKHYVQLYRHGKILNRTNKDPNEIIEHENYAEIVLYNKKQEEVSRALIDLEDIDKVKDLKWYMDSRGYAFNGKKRVLLHRLVMDCPNDMIVDHINHNRLDNRKENLRICNSSQNNMNRNKTNRNTSGYTGVCYKPKINKWQSYITINKKSIHLGYYNTPEEANEIRKQAEIDYFGEYRNKNQKGGGDNSL